MPRGPTPLRKTEISMVVCINKKIDLNSPTFFKLIYQMPSLLRKLRLDGLNGFPALPHSIRVLAPCELVLDVGVGHE